MVFKQRWLGLMAFVFCLVMNVSDASRIIPVIWVDGHRAGQSAGSITADDTIYGLILIPHLSGLSPGMHGFAVHTVGCCNHGAEGAGNHFDPERTFSHRGPFRGNGHVGDLPVLTVDARGYATLPLLAPRLKLEQIQGRSLVIVAGGDNYSDKPLRFNASKQRIACGVVPYH